MKISKSAGAGLLALASALCFGDEIHNDTVDGLTWSYTLSGGSATIFGGQSLEWDDEEEDYTWEYTPAIAMETFGAIAVPPSLGGYPVKAIGEGAFTECYMLTSVTIPSGVTSIGADAFSDCGSLAEVALPEGLEYIGEDAFDGCSSLRSIALPTSLAFIGERAFDDCASLTSLYIPQNVKTVGYHAFARCTSLKTVEAPETLRAQIAAAAAFYKCSPKITYYATGARKITVAGGFLDDDTTMRSGLSAGYEICAYADESKMYDRNENWVNAFANWTYTPATADLGEDFDPFSPEVTVSMPDADVKLTANFVNGFAAFLSVGYGTVGEAEPGDLYWSVDNGKTLIPVDASLEEGGYPVKAGKVTVKFYDKTGNWRAADVTFTVDKRVTYREDGVTYYEYPECLELPVEVKFVPVNSSTKVKLDANGGSGSPEMYFANGYQYGDMEVPSRKGYVFAGWWTAKDGGEHITNDKIFCPADFAGQKTPTLYAHWLKLQKLTLKDDSAHAEWSLDEECFDPELYDEIVYANPDLKYGGCLEGKGVLEVLPGARVSVGVDDKIIDRNWKELVFQKWTVSPTGANLGDDFRVTQSTTEFTMPAADVTLQATYIDESTCGWVSATAYASSVYLGNDSETGEALYIEPPYSAFEWSPDGGKTWYKTGYWESEGYLDYDGTTGEEFWVETGRSWVDEDVLLKKGSYTVTWRSTDPRWTTSDKITITIGSSSLCCGMSMSSVSVAATFTYVPQVVVDLLTANRNGELAGSTACGTVTMNPKDGLVPIGKAITLTAKAANGYAFQGWVLSESWSYGSPFEETAGTWKLENYSRVSCSGASGWLYDYISPDDGMVHVKAVFKAYADYSADDIGFSGFAGRYGSYVASGGAVDFRAIAGCAVESYLHGSPVARPLTYKLDGKLPDGLKFDAKTGLLSGVPKKPGSATVKVVASDPAGNSKAFTVNISVGELPPWLVGDYRGAMEDGGQNGLLELSVKSDGKVSAKVITRYGSRSVSGSLEWRDPKASYDEDWDDEYWNDDDDDDEHAEFKFYHTDAKDDSWCHVYFRPDGTIDGYADSYDKKEDDWAGGDLTGLRQDKGLFPDSGFLDKYYTFAFSAETTSSSSHYDAELGCEVLDESTMQSGYGYLTIKTDKNGAAKVVGQLPDGERVSMSALVLPFADENVAKARLYVFASPSSYKKQDWFAMALTFNQDGSVSSEDGAAWTIAGDYNVSGSSSCSPSYSSPSVTVFGEGALYSAAAPLENYYWNVRCAYCGNVQLEYSWKETESYEDDYGRLKTYTHAVYDYASAQSFNGYFFNVAVKGDMKGAISLEKKSPAPWEEKETYKGGDGKTYTDKWWNYDEDKNGNPITDPSQLSISFTKATGIFTGKASVYFDYFNPGSETDQHKSASLPYAGVMINEGDGALSGFGAALYNYTYTEYDEEKGKSVSVKDVVSLPVSLESPTSDEEP